MFAENQLLADALPEYFRRNARIRAANTKDQYLFAVRDLSESLLRPAVVGDLNESAVAGMRELLLKRSLAIRTINERIGRLLTLWSWLHVRNYLPAGPTVSRLREPQRVPSAWTLVQMQRLLAALSAAKGKVDGIPEGMWWRSLILTMWSTGERISALLSARWCDFDTESGWLMIPAEFRKGQSADGAYRLSEDAKASVLAIKSPPRDKIWPWPFVRSYLWIRYRSLLRKAGLPTGRYSGFHRIRRTVASYYDLAGGDASRLLGHRDRRTTAAYLDPRISPTPQASEKLPRIG